MFEQNYRSKCCHAKVKTHGIPDFPGSKEICTFNFSCAKCGKSCHIVGVRGNKLKASKIEKRIQSQKKRLDF